jgi:hypothetical protein
MKSGILGLSVKH